MHDRIRQIAIYRGPNAHHIFVSNAFLIAHSKPVASLSAAPNFFMASLQAGATPVEDVIAEKEATTKEPQVVAPPPPPPPETVKTVDVDDEDDLEELSTPPYEEKVENSDNEEEKDIEYSPFVETEDAPPFTYAGESATFGDFNEDDDVEDEDDA